MLSRVADSLFWMSRYLERAEHIARVVNVNLNLTLDRGPGDAALTWGRLLTALPAPPPWLTPEPASAAERAIVDVGNRQSILACIGAARENARQVREEISSEIREEINRLYLRVRTGADDVEWGAPTHDFLTDAIGGVHLFQGVTDATMTHGEGWHFMELGRYIERTGATAALLDIQFREGAWTGEETGVGEYVEWVGLLRSCCAFEAYCRHYTADVRARRIAEFLVLNANFPRSIHFAVGRIQASLVALAELSGRSNGPAERLAGRLQASLDYGHVDDIFDELPLFLSGIIRQANQINAAIHQRYIAYPIETALAG